MHFREVIKYNYGHGDVGLFSIGCPVETEYAERVALRGRTARSAIFAS